MTIDFAGATDPEDTKYNRKFQATITWVDFEIDPSTPKEKAGAAFSEVINDYADQVIRVDSVTNVEEL